MELRFRIETAVKISGARLAVERALHPEVYVNSARVEWSTTSDYWVDECFQTIVLPDLEAGTHTRSLTFGDWTRQGLPFYSGNVTYEAMLDASPGSYRVSIPKFEGTLVTVDLDGQRVGPVSYPPLELELGALAVGPHKLHLTVYGNRVNAFGPVHCSNQHLEWLGPNSYRTKGSEWAYEYQIRPMGLLVAPTIERKIS